MLLPRRLASPKASRPLGRGVLYPVVMAVAVATLCCVGGRGGRPAWAAVQLAVAPDPLPRPRPRLLSSAPFPPGAAPVFQPLPEQVRADVEAILEAGPRVAGSLSHGHNFTRALIVDRLRALGLDVEIDAFTAPTVLGPRAFYNIIGTWSATRQEGTAEELQPVLVLAAHYDSKLFDYPFVGASDAAASCAMLLDLAHRVTRWAGRTAAPVRLTEVKFVFFDGEEAFVQWSAEDSVYGARHLAGRWAAEGVAARIELFVLLDLIGCDDCQFVSWFPDTHHYHLQLARVERDLRIQGRIKRPQPYFRRALLPDGVEDDHLPFLQRGVPVLHLIAYPFPAVWHKPTDTLAALNFDVIHDVLAVLRRFLAAFLTAPNSTATALTK